MRFPSITPSLKRSIKFLLKLFQSLTNTMAGTDAQISRVSDGSPFDPLKPSVPISYPIKKLEDLLSRSYFDSFHYPFNKASTPLPSSSSSLPSRPRILACHDMAGGYIDDKWVQGGTNSDAYAIWHWYLIDVFVYFSHSLVTIPPPCWTNAAHLHGVKVLGTFITEWDEGKAICDVLLSTKESAELYAERLTELAVSLGFDGWLLNIEVNLDVAQIPNLEEFVHHLTETMHSSLPGSLVIWYDSVTKYGKLDWQNQLNEYNKPFFDLCDGIFANYTWQKDYPKHSATVAAERKFDVYMGIDVFGRNTYGGGQWTTNVALDVLKTDDVSAAIFAPGWVYETKQLPDFQTAQNRWWGLVEESWGILQKYPKGLPFYSTFDQGHGLHIYSEGLQLSSNAWNNISSQTFQPILDGSSDPAKSTIQASINFKEATYLGGACMTFEGSLGVDSSVTIRLFDGEIPLHDQPIHISYSVKLDGSSQLGLSLGFSKLSERSSVLLAPRRRTLRPANRISGQFAEVVSPVTIMSSTTRERDQAEWSIHEMSISMKDYTLTDINAVCYRESSPVLNHPPSNPDIKADSGSTTLSSAASEYNASLGHISIGASGQNIVFPPASSWDIGGQNITWGSTSQGAKTVSLKINWKLEGGIDTSLFSKYNIYIGTSGKQVSSAGTDQVGRGEEYLGVARVEAFYVSDHVVPEGDSNVLFIIQVCGVDGVCQKLDESPTFQLNVSG
ncbi:cytosolic endo-beta-N-acetylglucosaminidase 1-like [Aristolochia californica]|uniref:cytosolic endo-beta-N-acetylglucosaminidase 1-like n=1 Tax=Aristolochia californica TaxID=171875 RepID=UPI0035D646B2